MEIGATVSEGKVFYVYSYLLNQCSRWCDEHEANIIRRVREIVSRGSVFIDVGAAFGLWSIKFSDRFGLVIALEPDPRSYALLVKNVAENMLTNVIPMRFAAHSYPTTLYMCLDEPPLNCRVHSSRPRGCRRVVEIDAVPVDYVANLVTRKIDLLKIDVEGAEKTVLRGASVTIEYERPIVVVETKEFVEDIEGYLRCLGYSVEKHKYLDAVYIIGVSRR